MVDEMIAHALCALRFTDIKTHHIQKDVTRWICENYVFINPETVIREFRRMCLSTEHEIVKSREGKFVRFKIRRLFNLKFNKEQGTLF